MRIMQGDQRLHLAGFCLLLMAQSRRLGSVDKVPAWHGYGRNLLILTAENCGTVIPQWNYNA